MKKIFKFTFLFLLIFGLTGCLKRDTMEDISIYTTNYPTTYIVSRLYGKFSNIESIYPNGSNINDYSLTEKQIKDYSKADLFVFNGLSKEKKYVTKMRRENRELKIIDTTLSMEYSHDMSELWLDPSNFLMMAQNVKTGLREYIDSYYLNSKINSNYEKLKIEASNLDAKIKDIVSNADNKVIVTSNTLFKYLEKYGLTVYVLDENDSNIGITSNEVKKLFKNGDIKYIFIKSDEEEKTLIKNFVSSYGAIVQKWHTLSNISEIEASENQDYFSIMNDNLELLKNELYN